MTEFSFSGKPKSWQCRSESGGGRSRPEDSGYSHLVPTVFSPIPVGFVFIPEGASGGPELRGQSPGRAVMGAET